MESQRVGAVGVGRLTTKSRQAECEQFSESSHTTQRDAVCSSSQFGHHTSQQEGERNAAKRMMRLKAKDQIVSLVVA
jgi:hypothetical protein